MAGGNTILAQSNPAASTLTDILTVAGSETVGQIAICNQDTVAAQVRLAISPGGEAIDAKHYLLYGETLGPGRTLVVDFRPRGLQLGNATIIRGYANSASVSFNVIGA